MHAEVPRKDASQEENLLIEAVSLLVQRQRETETWIANQVWQAEQRTTAAEQRYAELETRLASIEDQLNRLARELSPGGSDSAGGERLARLREQVQDLRSGTEVRPGAGRGTAPIPLPARGEGEARSEPAPIAADARRQDPAAADSLRPAHSAIDPRSTEPAVGETGRRQGVPVDPRRTDPGDLSPEPARQSTGWLQLIGATPQDRFGFVLIAIGAIAILYAVLSQLRFG